MKFHCDSFYHLHVQRDCSKTILYFVVTEDSRITAEYGKNAASGFSSIILPRSGIGSTMPSSIWS